MSFSFLLLKERKTSNRIKSKLDGSTYTKLDRDNSNSYNLEEFHQMKVR